MGGGEPAGSCRGTLTLDENLAVEERRFNAANPDGDGILDAKELNTRAGKALLR